MDSHYDPHITKSASQYASFKINFGKFCRIFHEFWALSISSNSIEDFLLFFMVYSRALTDISIATCRLIFSFECEYNIPGQIHVFIFLIHILEYLNENLNQLCCTCDLTEFFKCHMINDHGCGENTRVFMTFMTGYIDIYELTHTHLIIQFMKCIYFSNHQTKIFMTLFLSKT